MTRASQNTRLKVAHIVTLLELGGAQQNTLYTLQHLDRQRFEPILLCGQGALLDHDAEKGNYPTFYITHLVRSIRPVRDLFALFEIYFVLKRERPHIVHTHSSKAGILGRWAARWANVPVVVHTYHGFGFNREQKFWTRWIFVWLEKWAGRITDRLVFVSKSNLEEAADQKIGGREQFLLIRSGVPLNLYQSLSRRPNPPEGLEALQSKHTVVTTVGPFKPQKNLIDFIRAAAIVHEKRPEARFWVVGDGALRPVLEKEVERRQLGDAVFLVGWRRDMPNILMRSNIFVLTSLWEGLPRALVEAMAAALPCVANAIDGVQDILNDGVNGFLVPPKNPAKTAERIIYLIDNPHFSVQMGSTARQSVGEEFDIDAMVHRQEKLYEELSAAGSCR